MSYFLCEQRLEVGQTFTFSGPDAVHLLGARRARPGEQFEVQDAAGQRFTAELVQAARRDAQVRVLAPCPLPPPPTRWVRLWQGAVKDKAAEWIVQKCTELGVAEIGFFPAQHSSIARRGGEKALLSRWERIAWEACKQSGRPAPPRLMHADSLQAVLKEAPTGEVRWLCHPGAPAQPPGRALAALPATGAITVLIGPEGGLHDEEAAWAREQGFVQIHLGGTILRAETAAVSAATLALLG